MIGLRTGLAAVSFLLAAAGSAAAADLGGPRISIKDTEAPAPYRSCSGERFRGFYAGGTLGLTGYNSHWQETLADFNDYQDHPLKTTRTGVSGGLGIGYNFVRCNFLAGIEGDVNFANISGSTDHYPLDPTVSGTGYAKITDGIRNYMTLRTRMGFVADRTLFYATGGLAWAKTNHRLEDMDHFNGGSLIPDPNFSSWKTGWTIGGGFETALTELVSLKAEALYMDFGKRSYSFPDTAVPPDVYAFRSNNSAVTARIGLNIKLGPPPRSSSDRYDTDCGGRSSAGSGACPLK